MRKIICPVCRKMFEAKSPLRKYCSLHCLQYQSTKNYLARRAERERQEGKCH